MSQYRYLILTTTELDHIDYLLDMNHRDGIYWGNYDQFQKRTETIKKKIKDARDRILVVSEKDNGIRAERPVPNRDDGNV